mgnify:CR=1 FL=1
MAASAREEWGRKEGRRALGEMVGRRWSELRAHGDELMVVAASFGRGASSGGERTKEKKEKGKTGAAGKKRERKKERKEKKKKENEEKRKGKFFFYKNYSNVNRPNWKLL